MADRRSLGTALKMTPEQKAFIENGGGTTRPVQPPSASESQATGKQREDEPEAAPAASGRMWRRSRRRPGGRGTLPPVEGTLLGVANLLVPLTTRLRPATAEILKRAGLEQKLRGQSPATVQEIVE